LSQGQNTLALGGNWNNGNIYTTSGTNSTVKFNGGNESIGGTTTFNKQTIISTGIVTLTSNITLNSSGIGTGVINVISGTFDLSTFMANRGITFPGGTLSVSGGA